MAQYAFHVSGRFSESYRAIFADMEVREVPAETDIVATVTDDQIHDVLARIQDLGLNLVSIERLAP